MRFLPARCIWLGQRFQRDTKQIVENLPISLLIVAADFGENIAAEEKSAGERCTSWKHMVETLEMRRIEPNSSVSKRIMSTYLFIHLGYNAPEHRKYFQGCRINDSEAYRAALEKQ